MRCRPLTKNERLGGARGITRLVDDKVVVVMDPDPEGHQRRKQYGQGVQHKEKRYKFDRAFDGNCTNPQVYDNTVRGLIPGVLKGLNATVFAYGATGSGKTYTMVGNERDPGLMVMSLRDIFHQMDLDREKEFDVRCSYLEVYNEVIYDLLQVNSPGLELREDPELGPQVAGLKRVQVSSADKIFQLLREGNMRRKTEATDANATSSRSHAVLEIIVNRSDKNHYQKSVFRGKLTLVDLAGAERAHETNNAGQQLRDGANINRSLLALANCINALGKRKKKGFVFVPFRNSKLTRLLKDGLCGNSRTIMIATVASADTQYNHTVNTLKYADRAKEIKTHVRVDKKTVDAHIVEYQRMIDALTEENRELKDGIRALQGGKPLPKSLPVTQAPKQASSDFSSPNADWIGARMERVKSIHKEHKAKTASLLNMEKQAIQQKMNLEYFEEAMAAEVRGGQKGSDLTGLRDRQRATAAAMTKSMSQLGQIKGTMEQANARLAAVTQEIAQVPVNNQAFQDLKDTVLETSQSMHESELQHRIMSRDAVILEQQQVIAHLWKIMEWGQVRKERALVLARENGLVEQKENSVHQVSEGAREMEFMHMITGNRAQTMYDCCSSAGEFKKAKASLGDSGTLPKPQASVSPAKVLNAIPSASPVQVPKTRRSMEEMRTNYSEKKKAASVSQSTESLSSRENRQRRPLQGASQAANSQLETNMKDLKKASPYGLPAGKLKHLANLKRRASKLSSARQAFG